MSAGDTPRPVLAVSAYYADRHMGELSAHVRDGGVVRVMDLRRETDVWISAGVIPDSVLELADRMYLEHRRQAQLSVRRVVSP